MNRACITTVLSCVIRSAPPFEGSRMTKSCNPYLILPTVYAISAPTLPWSYPVPWNIMFYAISGRKADAEKVLEDLEKLSTETYVTPFGRAAIYAGLRDKDKTMEWLEKAYEERSFLTWLKVDPAFDPMRDDSRFISFLVKLGLGRNRTS